MIFLEQNTTTSLSWAPLEEDMDLNEYLKLNFISVRRCSKESGVSLQIIRDILKKKKKRYHEETKEKIWEYTKKNVNINDFLDK